MNDLVVDTSVWIHFFEGKTIPELECALKEGCVVLSPVVFAELLSGRTAGSEDKDLLDFLEELELTATPRSHWLAVGRMRRLCGTKGFRISIPDAHIAQAALDCDGTLYSYDRIFERMAKVMPLRLLKV